MIWRRRYDTIVQRDLDIDATDGVAVGVTSFESLSEAGVWFRLMDQAGLDFRFEPIGVDLVELEALVPPSISRRFAEPAAVAVEANRSFAYIARGGRIALLMIGPPTEDAWEEFEATARAGSNSAG